LIFCLIHGLVSAFQCFLAIDFIRRENSANARGYCDISGGALLFDARRILSAVALASFSS